MNGGAWVFEAIPESEMVELVPDVFSGLDGEACYPLVRGLESGTLLEEANVGAPLDLIAGGKEYRVEVTGSWMAAHEVSGVAAPSLCSECCQWGIEEAAVDAHEGCGHPFEGMLVRGLAMLEVQVDEVCTARLGGHGIGGVEAFQIEDWPQRTSLHEACYHRYGAGEDIVEVGALPEDLFLDVEEVL